MATIKDDNNIPKLLKEIKYLATHRIEVGIFGKDDSKILMIARVNEFGVNIQVTEAMRNYLHATGLHLKKSTKTITIPERSFIRSGFDENNKKIQRQAEKLLSDVLDMKLKAKNAMEVVGQIIVTQLQSYMTSVSSPANHPYTANKKGSSNPLIDEGHLRDSIVYKIRSS